MTPTPPKFSRFLSCLAVVMSLSTALDASAVVFGEIRSSSRLGELLHAEIEVDDEPADRFDTSCVKLYQPAQAAPELPWITEARLNFRRENGKGRLYISSDRPLRDPVVQIGVQSTCPGGRVWRDYTLLVSPAGGGAREAVPSLLKPAVSEKPIDRVSLSAQGASAMTRRSRGADGVMALRMASELRATEAIGEAERDRLRLEYRMLTVLYEQADSQLVRAANLPDPERLGASPAVTPAPAATPELQPVPVIEKTEPASAPSATTLPPPVLEPVALQMIPKARPEVLPPEETKDLSGWPLYAGLGAAALGVALLVRRRQRNAALDAHFLPMHAPTIIVDEPAFSQPPETAVAAAVVATGEAPEPETVPPVPQDVPALSEKLEVSPVMELAEIMLSFGRVHGAAQTLQEYIEANPKEALQPWIRLLEIYRENGMRAEFEKLAANLNQNFNVEIVHWDKAVGGERVEMTLELLPHIRDQIDALWGRPECLEYLQKLLHDNRDGERNGFALPVVKEILSLIDLMVAEKAAA